MSWSGIPYAIEAILGERKKRDEIRDKAMKKLRASTTGDRTMSDETLKPCPFCGCAFPAVGYDGDAKTLGRKECITARCRQCGGETRKFSSQAEAITAWNTRADDDRIEALQAENAKLREALRRISIGDGIGGPDAELQCADIARKALQETER